MALKRFTDFLNRICYEETGTVATETSEESTEITQEETEAFETSMSEENGENIAEMAKKIIADSQVESDNDEFPDICNVQSVLDTAGMDADHELVRKILTNFVHCNPDELELDGVNRKQAILDAIDRTKKQAEALKQEKARDEENLMQAEREAESACTEAISQANMESERAIEEEKARSAAVIAEIRKNTDSAIELAKQQRDITLENISMQRTENEATINKSASLVTETEKYGQTVVNQIEVWLEYLK